MSTTRSQKRRNDQQSTSENVSEGLISPIVVGNPCPLNQDDEVAGPSNPKSPRIENSLLESLRASLKEEITSEIKNLLIESQKEMLKLLKPETRGIIRENTEEEVEEETRNFYTPTKSVRISSTQNDPIICRNTMDVEIAAGPSNSASAATGTREETGRKRLTEETASVTPAGSVTESPTSRPPPDKRADVPRPQLKSVVIPRSPYRVGHLGRGAPQMSLADAIEQYGDPDAGSKVSSVPSGTNPIDMSLEIPETVEEARPPAFLPPSDDISGSVVTNDSKRIWMAAEHLYPSQCAIKKRTPPTETEQKEINRTTIPAQVTRSLRPRDADMSEQAWEQRAREQLPTTTNDYMAPLQHNITEQFPARYVLREGETWEANARNARNLRSLKPFLKAALQRARYCMAVDSTCRSDLPIDNLMPDVLVLTMPLSRFAEIAEMVGAIYDPNLRGSQKEPPPQRVIFANLLDHMACEELLRDLDAIMSDVRQPGDIAALVNEVVGHCSRRDPSGSSGSARALCIPTRIYVLATKSTAVRLHSAGGMQGAQSRIRYLCTELACGPRGPAPRYLIVSSLLCRRI